MMQPLYWDLQRLSCKAPFNAQYRTMAEGIPVPKWFVQRNLGAKAKKNDFDAFFQWCLIWWSCGSPFGWDLNLLPVCTLNLYFVLPVYDLRRSAAEDIIITHAAAAARNLTQPPHCDLSVPRAAPVAQASLLISPHRNVRSPGKKQCFVQIRTFKSHPWCCKAP